MYVYAIDSRGIPYINADAMPTMVLILLPTYILLIRSTIGLPKSFGRYGLIIPIYLRIRLFNFFLLIIRSLKQL